jgi:hypothetical protein
MIGGKERERVVAPVVGQAAPGQSGLVEMLINRQQLDRGDANPAEMIDRRRRCETGVGAAEIRRDLVVERGEALDVQFVDHGVAPRCAQRLVLARRQRLGDRRQRGVRRAVRLVGGAVGLGASACACNA